MNSVEETLILWWTWRGAPTARVCPLIMAGKAAAVQDRDVPRPNCYIYAKRGGPSAQTRSVMPGPTVLLNPRGLSPPCSTWKRVYWSKWYGRKTASKSKIRISKSVKCVLLIILELKEEFLKVIMREFKIIYEIWTIICSILVYVWILYLMYYWLLNDHWNCQISG